VYICGGFDGFRSFKDVWRFDFDTLQWEKLGQVYNASASIQFQSTAVTLSGRICVIMVA